MACIDADDRFWDNVARKIKGFLDIHKATAKAVIDFVSGILGLAFALIKMAGALNVAVVTIPFGTTPQWVKDTGTEVMEGARGIAQILKNAGRALAALGQKATDVVEEKGIPYAVSYMVADITIGILVDKGIGKLRSLGKADDLAKISTKLDDVVDVADDLGNAAKAVDKIDDAADAVKVVEKIDDIGDTAKTVDKVNDAIGTSGLEGGTASNYGIDMDNLNFSNTVQNHSGRPYQDSKLLINEIIESKPPVPDPRGTNALSWTVEGTFNASTGCYELIIDPTSNTVWHFVFKSQ